MSVDPTNQTPAPLKQKNEDAQTNAEADNKKAGSFKGANVVPQKTVLSRQRSFTMEAQPNAILASSTAAVEAPGQKFLEKNIKSKGDVNAKPATLSPAQQKHVQKTLQQTTTASTASTASIASVPSLSEAELQLKSFNERFEQLDKQCILLRHAIHTGYTSGDIGTVLLKQRADKPQPITEAELQRAPNAVGQWDTLHNSISQLSILDNQLDALVKNIEERFPKENRTTASVQLLRQINELKTKNEQMVDSYIQSYNDYYFGGIFQNDKQIRTMRKDPTYQKQLLEHIISTSALPIVDFKKDSPMLALVKKEMVDALLLPENKASLMKVHKLLHRLSLAGGLLEALKSRDPLFKNLAEHIEKYAQIHIKEQAAFEKQCASFMKQALELKTEFMEAFSIRKSSTVQPLDAFNKFQVLYERCSKLVQEWQTFTIGKSRDELKSLVKQVNIEQMLVDMGQYTSYFAESIVENVHTVVFALDDLIAKLSDINVAETNLKELEQAQKEIELVAPFSKYFTTNLKKMFDACKNIFPRLFRELKGIINALDRYDFLKTEKTDHAIQKIYEEIYSKVQAIGKKAEISSNREELEGFLKQLNDQENETTPLEGQLLAEIIPSSENNPYIQAIQEISRIRELILIKLGPKQAK